MDLSSLDGISTDYLQKDSWFRDPENCGRLDLHAHAQHRHTYWRPAGVQPGMEAVIDVKGNGSVKCFAVPTISKQERKA